MTRPYDPLTATTAEMYREGERRIRERRVAPVSDETTRLVNLLTEDRDKYRHLYAKMLLDRTNLYCETLRLIAENRRLREAVAKAARQIELGMRSPASRSTLHGAVEDSEGAGGRVQEN